MRPEPWHADNDVTIYHGDALATLRELPDESVQMCATSPPFWALRDYGVDGQLGQEATLKEWAANLVDVFREVRRVLKPDGTLWVEVGDSYNAGTAGRNGGKSGAARDHLTVAYWRKAGQMGDRRINAPGLKVKDLIGQPWTLAFALRDDGWWLRAEVIWARTNPTPEPTPDRPIKSHSTIFMLTKRARYLYHPMREPSSGTANRKGRKLATPREANGHHAGWHAATADLVDERLVRDVWLVPVEGNAVEHYATWPREIARRMILASTSEGDVVLDPFLGTGTTALVARQHRRRAVGVELSPAYLEQARRRLALPDVDGAVPVGGGHAQMTLLG
ncbi:MAG TPA: site-specific DNA-methyltransferase [Dehalococcoidia bacterium]|nr:site-specific DNA-methyltransferase [Dehalococcoidia bacterium]